MRSRCPLAVGMLLPNVREAIRAPFLILAQDARKELTACLRNGTLRSGDSVVFEYTDGMRHQGRVVGDAPAVRLVAYVVNPSQAS